MSNLEALAPGLVAQFERIVRRDGGALKLVSAKDGVLRVAYRPGAPPADCEDGVCMIPEVELQTMMGEVLAAQAPEAKLEIERLA